MSEMRTQPQGDAPQAAAGPAMASGEGVADSVAEAATAGTQAGAAEPAGLFDDLDVGALYDQLRQVARVLLRKEGPGPGGAPSSLVNDAMLRLSVWGRERRATGMPVWGSPEEFFALAVQVMQRVIIDRARRQRSLKRGGPGSGTGTGAVRSLRVEVDLASLAEGSGAIAAGWGGSKGAAGAAGRDEQPGGAAWASTPGGAGGEPDWETLEQLQRALEELRQVDQRCYEVVNLRFYLGLTTGEVAEVRQCDRQQVEQDWRMARAWLLRRLNQQGRAEPGS